MLNERRGFRKKYFLRMLSAFGSVGPSLQKTKTKRTLFHSEPRCGVDSDIQVTELKQRANIVSYV